LEINGREPAVEKPEAAPLEIVLKLAFSLCKSERELTDYAKVLADLIALATPEIQAAARAVFTARRDEIRKETK
jgi:hypothetical protein